MRQPSLNDGQRNELVTFSGATVDRTTCRWWSIDAVPEGGGELSGDPTWCCQGCYWGPYREPGSGEGTWDHMPRWGCISRGDHNYLLFLEPRRQRWLVQKLLAQPHMMWQGLQRGALPLLNLSAPSGLSVVADESSLVCCCCATLKLHIGEGKDQTV